MEKTFSRREFLGRCDVCGKEGSVVTNRSTFGPFDFSYCEECLRTGAEPYWFTVSTVALHGLWPNDLNEAFQMKIRGILKYLNRSEDRFRTDVYRAYMMAKKALLFKDTRTYNKIMAEADPAVCKALGKSAANFDQQLWDSCKEEIIYNANYAKFSQNPALKAALLATGDAIIAEASPGDKIWGIGMKATDPNSKDPSKWPGQNLLGKALMGVRSELRDSSK